MARRRRSNQGSEVPFGEWLPAHAVRFNEDGTVSMMTERPEHNPQQTDRERDELRLKQDFLLMLAGNANVPESYRITDHPGAPTLSDIRKYIYPDWEHTIDHQIRELAREQKIGVPDFSRLGNRGRRNPFGKHQFAATGKPRLAFSKDLFKSASLTGDMRLVPRGTPLTILRRDKKSGRMLVQADDYGAESYGWIWPEEVREEE